MNISILTLAVVVLLIAIRQVGNIKVQMWQSMLFGAAVVIITGQISVAAAISAINMDVMVFLFGMFVVGQALEESGYLAHLSYKYFKRAKSIDALMLYIIMGAGIMSAFLMNDTLAIIGTPVVLLLARKHQMSPKLLLLALCFAVTIGSVMSPIGNPQNLLIAVNGGMKNPFGSFFTWLAIPTLVNLLVAYVVLKFFYKHDFHDAALSHSQEPIKNHDLALLAKISLNIIVVLVAVKVLIVALGLSFDFRLPYIAVVAALPILVGSPKRFQILGRIDWHTLVFFAAMFVLMESVWLSGFFQSFINGFDLASVPVILSVSVVLSQFISNVPLVALYQPMLKVAGGSAKELLALAAGSTIAGNFFILGAASNVIVIQNAEKKAHETLTFLEFAKVGIPLTIMNLFIYWVFLQAL